MRRSIWMVPFLVVALTGVGSAVAAPTAGAAIIPGKCEWSALQPTLRQDAKQPADAVRQAQCQLNLAVRDRNIAVDGDFGPKTAALVRLFQKCAGIASDGIIGPITWKRLNFYSFRPHVPC